MKRKSVSSSKPFMALEGLEDRKLLSLTASLVEVPISQAAINADPTLANYKTFDLQMNLDKGERWIATDLQAELTAGSFYNASAADGGDTVPVKQFWAAHPQAQFDTFVCASNFQIPTILGEFNPATINGGVFKAKETNVAFGSLTDTGTGTFTVARLTLTKDASGTILGDLGSTLVDANHLKPYSFTLNGGKIVTPTTPPPTPTPTQFSQISGNLFNDTNGNGKDDGDAGLSGWKVYLDKNQNGKFDNGEKYRLTDASGNYLFEQLTPGTYYVHETLPTGYRRTAPSKTSYTVVLSDGVNGTGKNFGNTTTALLSGTVFNDKNKNGKLDKGEAGLSGFTIWVDSDKDGKLDSGEKTADTDSNGYWVFKAMKSGTYVVRIAARSGYKNKGGTMFTIKVAAGGSYTGRLFAEYKA